MSEQLIQQENHDEISLKELILKAKEWFAYLWGFKFRILLASTIGGTLGFVYAKYFAEPSYTSTVSFTMEQKGGGGAGALGGLASSLGLGDLAGSASQSGMFGGENILMLMKSNRIIHEALKAPLPELKGGHLLNAYIENHFEDALKAKEMQLFPKQLDTVTFSREQDSVLLMVTKSLREEQLLADRADKKNTIINLMVTDKNEYWAYLFSKAVVQHAIDLYLEIKIGKILRTEQELTQKRDSIRGLLDGTITTLAFETDLNAHTPLMRYKTKQAKKQIDVEVLKTMYGNVIQNLEMTKFQRAQEEPIIEIIDDPILPLDKEQFGKAKGIVLGGFLAGIFILGFLVVRKLLKRILD